MKLIDLAQMNRKKRREQRREIEAFADSTSRPCGECTACCTVLRLTKLDGFAKAEGECCRHEEGGCRIYPSRPKTCKNFMCSWKSGYLPEDLRPDRSGFLMYPRLTNGMFWLLARDIVPGACETHFESFEHLAAFPLFVQPLKLVLGPEALAKKLGDLVLEHPFLL